MLVKIKGIGNKWLLFDDVSSIEYGSVPIKLKTDQQLRELSGLEQDVEVIHVFPGISEGSINGKDITVNTISFEKESQRYYIVFSSVCYVCNNAGKTIEKVVANERY